MSRKPKAGFPVGCPICEKICGKPNGHVKTAQGPLQQVRCEACKYQRTLDNRPALFRGLRVDVSIEPLLRGIAGVVLGLPMRATEKVVHIKGETITKKLVWLLEKERWEELDSVLENRFDIAKDDREEFYLEIVLGRKFDSAAFRCWGKKFGRLKPAARAKFLRQIARIVGRPAETITREIQLV